MSNIYMISDLHFGHENVIKFTDADGKIIRPFSSIEEMEDTIAVRWNKKVSGKHDLVYVLGDVSMKHQHIKTISRMRGRKILIKGNHDVFKPEYYQGYFENILSSHGIDNFILTHIPVHPSNLSRFRNGNIHGHLHNNLITIEVSHFPEIIREPDPRYINVSCERIDYTPISIEEIKSSRQFI